ncbi:NOL1/NOP2/sun family protein [Colletotrichum karsti]|uniref:NOL1/NOP2/sun family protein n=1 Tax=Colletotrichum karsti TaxID=1095194 RepID=A0A9P6HYD2_9PEZI|nr:NOL1/NOP2/sun family protein [Colletotrichum karsti]KAF9872694.1 NOL1/NOP2/sun family protein [Colletotrichum karsti]
MEPSEIYDKVNERYGSVAKSSTAGEYEQTVARAFGYSEEELARVPEGANLGVSCGNPIALANLREGETVVDLGSGAGFDVFAAADKVGLKGRAIGIDMNDEMLAKANAIKSKTPSSPHTAFVKGSITSVPLPSSSADCVISNCVINLVPAAEKQLAFLEMFRILKPGGRVAVSDILARRELTAEMRGDVALYVGCVAGASLVGEYEEFLGRAGFQDVVIVDSKSDLNVYYTAAGEGMTSCCSGGAPGEGVAPLGIADLNEWAGAMSLYHETAEILSASPDHGGSLKSRVFRKKGLKSPPAQVYALAFETAKWSGVLKEVVEAADLLRHERKLTPILALLLTHDFLLAKSGIALPQSHGLRQTIERHKARLTSEFTRARLRRKMPSVDELRADVNANADPEGRHPRWIRVNALKSDVETQLGTTFKGFERVLTIADVTKSTGKAIYIDAHVPNLLAASPGTDVTKSQAYKNGDIILQDKASCFPAYLLDPRPEDGDVIDSCAAPGNKTTHLAAVMKKHEPEQGAQKRTIFAFERDSKRAQTLEKMVRIAGSRGMTKIGLGQDFLEVDPKGEAYKNVGALLLDPSCSGSGIVGRDSMPELHLPEIAAPGGAKGKTKGAKPAAKPDNRKRKRDENEEAKQMMIDDDGNTVEIQSEQELQKRLNSLAGFQLTLLLHAMKFSAAKRITYSTCSIHAEENEGVVLKALESKLAKERGWRVLLREKQVTGMREWPVRGLPEACGGDKAIAEACIRTYKGDGHGVMGFFVAAFARDGDDVVDDDGPYVRDDEGKIIRDVTGMPVLKSTGEPVVLATNKDDEVVEDADDGEEEDESSEKSASSDDDDEEEGEEEWGGFD